MQLSLVSARLRGVSHIHGMVNLMWLGMPFGRETLDYPGSSALEHAKAQRAVTELLSVGPKCLVCIPSLPGLIIWIGGTNLIHNPYFFLCPLKHSSTWPKPLFKYINLKQNIEKACMNLLTHAHLYFAVISRNWKHILDHFLCSSL